MTPEFALLNFAVLMIETNPIPVKWLPFEMDLT
jgi:hypothetical protein